jgi:ADP-ribosylglycohydrolase
MSLAVAAALIGHGASAGEDAPAAIAQELLAWAQSPENDRAPGSTTMSACRRLASGRPWRESGISESKGCGSTIRTAPIGLYYAGDRARLVEVAGQSSLITHGHPCAVAGAVANAVATALALADTPPEDFLPQILEVTASISEEFVAKLNRVPEALSMAPEGAFDVLGDAWVAEEAMACGLYCFLRSPRDYRATVLAAANASGDSDSVACIAGGISGAYNGLSAIPQPWRTGVENAAGLLQTADDLWGASRPPA